MDSCTRGHQAFLPFLPEIELFTQRLFVESHNSAKMLRPVEQIAVIFAWNKNYYIFFTFFPLTF